MQKSNSYIVLFDSSSNIDNLKKILYTKPTIISFDYESHELLKKNNISHITSDSFSSRDDLVHIQNKCYEYVKWFEYDEIKQLIDYDGINLGLLIQVELNYLLVKFVKKFSEVVKIFTENNSATFFASPTLFELIRTFTNLVTELNSENITDLFYYDTLKIPLRIGSRNITIHVPKNRYLVLKRTLDSLLGILVWKQSHTKINKTILLVEFDPIRYKKFFEKSSTQHLNFLLYNRRKPPIWNLNSYSTIKKSSCRIITTNSVFDNVAKIRVAENLPKIKSKIQTMWKYDDFFQSFFSINNISFWTALKPIFRELFTKRALEAISEIETAKRVFEKNKLDSVLVLSETGSTEQILVKLAKKFGVKIVLLQHGLYFDSESNGAINMNKFQGVYPIDADKYVIWGKIEERNQIKNGTPKEKLLVLGSLQYDEDSGREYDNEHQNYILLATSGPVKENALDLTIETIDKNRQTIKKICEIVTKMNKNLIIKLHPSPDEFDPSELVKEINPNIVVKKTGDIKQLVKSCDVLIVIDVSTVILDGHLSKKPVISVSVKDSDYGIPSAQSQSCILTDINNLETILRQVLTDDNFRKTVITKGSNYVNEYLVNQRHASSKLLESLNDI